MAGNENVGEALLATTQEICITEFGVLLPIEGERRWAKQWPGNPDIFSPVIAITRVDFEPDTIDTQQPLVARAYIGIAENCEVEVIRGSEGDLDGDPFAGYVLGCLVSAFRAHPHQLCLDGLRQRSERVRGSLPGGIVKIVDRRRWQR